MAFVYWAANLRGTWPATPGLASITRRASVAVVAPSAIGLGRVRAGAGASIAHSREMTLILGRACHGIAPQTGSGLAAIRLRTLIFIVASGAIHLEGIRANTRASIAGADVIALVQHRARHRARAHATSFLAGIGLGASVVVVATATVGLRWV